MADAASIGGGARPARLPRWTRQEILVLIQGKKVAERRKSGPGSSSAASALVGAAPPLEPKWATVAAYCRRHGVSRGPVQCRKRWSNLASDYKKIKEWETRRKPESGGESFWVMRNDRRRERKLPGFFDKEVYDILDGAAEEEEDDEEEEEEAERREVAEATVASAVAAPAPTAAAEGEGEEETATAGIFDSGRSAADDALFSDYEQEQEEEDKDEEGRSPAAGARREPEAEEEAQRGSSPQEGGGRKRRRQTEEEGALPGQLVQILDRNSRALISHMEAQNVNLQLDREQRKQHGDSLVVVLGKVADALGRIADKL